MPSKPHSSLVFTFLLANLFFTACIESSKPKPVIQEQQDKVHDTKELKSANTKDTTDSVKLDDSIQYTKKIDTSASPKIVKEKVIQPKKVVTPKGFIAFENESYDFGEITEGDTIHLNYKFKNTGKAPIDINDVKASCGCTRPSYPFLPIMPGDEGQIGVSYISIGKEGDQTATITVKSNAKNKLVELALKGKVKPKALQKDN